MRGRTYAIAAALAVLVLLQLLPYGSSQITFYCASTGTLTGSIATCINATIFPYVVVALLFSFQLVAFTYLIGEVIGIPALKGWYRNELWESVKSLLIVGLLLFGILVMGTLAGALVSSNGPTEVNLGNLYTAANNYLNGVEQTAQASYYSIMGINVAVGYLESISLTYPGFIFPLYIPPYEVIGSIGTGSGFNPFASTIVTGGSGSTIITQTFSLLVVPTSIVVALQTQLVTYLAYIGLGVLLPIGIILRAIPFLRWIGGTFIALAITAAFIYPALIVFLNQTVTSTVPNLASLVSVANPGSDCQGWYILACGFFAIGDAPASLLYSGLGTCPGTYLACAYSNGYSAGEIAFFGGANGTPSFTPILNVLMDYAIPLGLQFILFILDLIIGVTVATSLATALGGRIRLGIGKFRVA